MTVEQLLEKYKKLYPGVPWEKGRQDDDFLYFSNSCSTVISLTTY